MNTFIVANLIRRLQGLWKIYILVNHNNNSKRNTTYLIRSIFYQGKSTAQFLFFVPSAEAQIVKLITNFLILIALSQVCYGHTKVQGKKNVPLNLLEIYVVTDYIISLIQI